MAPRSTRARASTSGSGRSLPSRACRRAPPVDSPRCCMRRAGVAARWRVTEWARQVTAGPRVQAGPSGGFTPLLYAARSGCVDCAAALIEAGADVNLTDPDRVTPLLLATVNLSFDTAALL